MIARINFEIRNINERLASVENDVDDDLAMLAVKAGCLPNNPYIISHRNHLVIIKRVSLKKARQELINCREQLRFVLKMNTL